MTSGGASPDLSALVGNLLSNPAAMSMLSSLLSGMGQPSQKPPSPPDDTSVPPLPPAQPVCAQPGCPHGGCPQTAPRDERAALLLALRPFLPPEKCDMIDGLLRILDLLTLLRGRRT